MGSHSISKDEAFQWLQAYHSSSSKLDARAWVTGFFAPNIALTFANLPTIHGADACLAVFEGQMARLAAMTHRIDSFDWVPDADADADGGVGGGGRGGRGGKILQKATVVYRVKGDAKNEDFVIPGFLVVRLARAEGGEPGRIVAVEKEVFIDLAPVRKRMEEVAAEEEKKKKKKEEGDV